VRGGLCALAATAVLGVGCGDGDEEVSAPPPAPAPPPTASEQSPSAPQRVEGEGFITRTPKGFADASTSAQPPQVLLLEGPASAGEPMLEIAVVRVQAPRIKTKLLGRPTAAASEEAGAKKVKNLPSRKVDGEPAVGFVYQGTGRSSSRVTQSTYTTQHGGFRYVITSTLGEGARPNGEEALNAVLDRWKWVR